MWVEFIYYEKVFENVFIYVLCEDIIVFYEGFKVVRIFICRFYKKRFLKLFCEEVCLILCVECKYYEVVFENVFV